MNTIKFTIWRISNDICRITSSHGLTAIRKLSDGACISTLDGLLDEMSRIKREAKAMGYNVMFEIEEDLRQ